MSRSETASVRELARLLRRCLEEGRAVHVERLGTFRPDEQGGFAFQADSKPRVFLAYAAEDAERVEQLYDRLERAGLSPWMDRRKLLPGQNWPRAIEGAIETADFFVACFSRQSVRKRGNFQSELRYALDCARLAPVDDVYLIPVRLEECRLPEEIRKRWHYVDLFPSFEDGARKLLQILRREMRRRAAA